MSEILSGVNTIENQGYFFVYIYICVDIRMSFCTLTHTYFCFSSVFDPVPNFTKQILLIY